MHPDTIPLPLQLRRSFQTSATPAALMVAGGAVETWLQVVADNGLNASRLMFLPLIVPPVAEPQGVLITGDCPREFVHASTGGSAVVVPYQCRAGRLYLPVDATLMPPASDAELQALLPAEQSRLLVWHPGLGLIGFDREHLRTAADLLDVPDVVIADCSATQPGEELNSRIHSLQPELPDDVTEILTSGADDIGTEADDIADAPRSPDEKSGAALRDAAGRFRDGVARAIHGFTSKLPTSPGGSQMLRRLHDWAQERLSGTASGSVGPGSPSRNLTTRRENELKRLLQMLENDPDRGLRFAIPSAGRNQRGVASPGGSLGEHSSSFDLSNLGGSGPADVWEIPWEYQVRLINHYRRLAERELRYGRYRRAAYIYASLLSDLHSAAQALESGGLHHDAAMVYLEHLRQPLKAAECLRRGGFWEEALQIYRNHDRWIDAGDLLLEMDEPDAARDAFHQEIQTCEQRLDFLAAGDVAETRLKDVDEATRLFVTGWMRNAAAPNCLRRALHLQADHGRHDHAASILEQLTNSSGIAADQLRHAVTICSEFAGDYPDVSLRAAVRRHTWRLAALLLRKDPTFGQPSAMSAVRRLAPSDRLLKTDTYRFEAEWQNQVRQAERAAKSSDRAIKHLDRFVPNLDLPPDVVWLQAIGNGDYIFRLGKLAQHMMVVRHKIVAQRGRAGIGATRGTFCFLNAPGSIFDHPFALRPNVARPDRVWLQPLPGMGGWYTETGDEQAISATNFADVIVPEIRFVLDVSHQATGSVWVLAHSDPEGLRLEQIGADNLVQQRIPLTFAEQQLVDSAERDPRSQGPVARLFAHARNHSIVIGRFVFRRSDNDASPEKLVRLIDTLPDAPICVAESPRSMVPRLAFSMDEGVRVIWPGTGSSCQIAAGLIRPATGFTSSGLFVAICQSTATMECYRLNAGTAALVGRREPDRPSSSMRQIVPGRRRNQFIVIDANGVMDLYEIPA